MGFIIAVILFTDRRLIFDCAFRFIPTPSMHWSMERFLISLNDSSLCDIDRCIKRAVFSLFSQVLCLCLDFFTVLPECRSCPGISPRRSPTLVRSYHGGTSPVGISHPDGHAVFKERLDAYRYIVAKKDALSRISKRMEMQDKRAKNLRLWTKAWYNIKKDGWGRKR